MDAIAVSTIIQLVLISFVILGVTYLFSRNGRFNRFKKHLLLTVALLGMFSLFGLYNINNVNAASHPPLLEISKEFSDGSTNLNVESGQQFTYRIRYRCASILQDCSGVQITDAIPPELQYISADGPISDITNISYSGGTVTFDFVEPLGAGTTGVLEITTRFAPGTLDGVTAVNEAVSVTAGGSFTSNQATATVVGSTFEMYANKNGASQMPYGYETTYTLQVCSPDTQAGIRLTNPEMIDNLPPTLTFVSASNGGIYDPITHTISWTYASNGGGLPDIIEVTAGCGLNVTVVVRVDPNGPDGAPGGGDDPAIGDTITNDFIITGDPEDGSTPYSEGVGTSGLITVPTFGDGVGKTVSTPSSYLGNEELPGGPVNYTINYNNSGLIDGTNLVLTDTVPVEIDVTSIEIGPSSAPGNPVNGFYEVGSNPGVWLPFPSNAYASNTNVSVAISPALGDIVLALGDRISGIRWEIGDVAAGGNWSARVDGTIDAGTPVPTTFNNCVDSASDYLDFYGVPGSSVNNDCVSVTTIDPRAIPIIGKNTSNNSLQPGEVAEFTLTIANHAVAQNPILGPMALIDMMPAEYELVIADAGAPGGYRVPTAGEISADAWFTLTFVGNDPSGTLTTTVTPNFSGTDTLLRWAWDATYQQNPGDSIDVSFFARVIAGTPPGPANNSAYILRSPSTNNPIQCTAGATGYDDTALDLDGDPATVDGCQISTNVTVEPFLSMDSQKFVWGQLDSSWSDYGYTVAGGNVDYRMVITNTGNVTATNIVVYDILPFVGDTGVVDPSNRGSTWRPNLQAPIVNTSGLPVTISYSQQQNPCRPEVLPSGPAGCVDDWSTTPPADITSVQAVRFDFCSGAVCAELGPDNGSGNGGALEFTWHMIAPNDAPQLVPAWNSFGYTAEDTDNNLQLLPSEPIRVGIELQQNTTPSVNIGDYVWLDVYGQQDDGIQQVEELGVNGVRVELWDDNGGSPVFVDYRVTGLDANGFDGYYQFVDVLAGDYFVRFFPPAGYTTSPANTTTDDLDSDGQTAGVDGTYGAYLETAVFTVTPDPDPLVTTDDDWTWDQGIWLDTDYGDAPATYPTEAATQVNPADAARHIIVPNLYMGAGVDAETDGQPDANAWGDDNNDGNDDEDGVTFADYIGTAANPSAIMIIGDSNNITVNTTVPATETAYLNAWIDFNGDGDWDDAGEQIATNMPSTGGNIIVPVNVAGSTPAGKTYARFRFSTEQNLLPTGTAIDGEVEDYVIQFVPEPVKSIVDTSEAHTTGTGFVAIGEIIRYRLEVTVPEGTMSNFTIDDNLPWGLRFFDDGTTTITTNADTSISIANNPPAITPAIFNRGTDPVFDLGTVINNDDDPNAETITLEFNALVLNTNGNNTSVWRGNNFDVSYNNYTDLSNRVVTYIVEPNITLAKSVTTTPLDAGDTVVYEIVVTAATGPYRTSAFEVNITDLLDGNLTLTNVSVVAPTAFTDNSNILGNQVDVMISRLDPGQLATVTVTATVNSSTPSGEIIPNVADVTYTSLPGPNGTTGNSTGSDTPGNSGDGDGERDGSNTPARNDYFATDNANVNLAEPTFDKQVSPTDYIIGEQITFDLLVTLPEGVTEDLIVVDDLPVGLAYVSEQVITTNAGSPLLSADFNGTLAAPTVNALGGDGVDVSWDFGATTTTVGDNVTTNNSFVIQVTAVVLDVFSNQTGDTLTNTGTLTYTRNGVSRDIVDTQDVNLIEPVLAIAKTLVTPIPSPLDAGTNISYQIVLQHDATSLADAYDVVISDAIPAQLTGISNVTVNATGIAAPSFDLTGNDLRLPAAGTFDLPQGATVTITFDATIGGTAVPGQQIDNDAAATWTSLNGTPPEERNGGATDPDGNDLYDNGTGTATDDYETVDTAGFTVDNVAFLKALTATSAGHTAGSDVTLGEIVTYVLTATVPEGSIPSLTIVDNLPAGLSYVAGSASVDTTGFSGSLPAPTVTAAGGSGVDVTWEFGAFTVPADNDPTNNSFTLTLQAVVMDEVGNIGVAPQTVLTNVATVQVGTDTPTSSNPVDVDVVEPQLTIAKDFDRTQVTPNESTVVTLVVENTGLASAFDVVVEDPLANDTFTNITEGTTPAGWTFTTVASGSDTIVRYTLAAGTPFPIGASATFTFTVTMHPDLAPSPPNVNNIATITDASTLDSTVNDGDEDNATNVDEEREYTTSDNDQLTIITPDLVLTKSNGVTYVSPSDVVIYDLNVENVGGADATGVVITETVPANTTFNLANSSATWAGCADGAAAGSVCVFTIGNLNSGANTTVQFAVNIDNPLPANTATITNTAVTADDGTNGNDPTPANNSDNHADTVTAAIGDYVWEDNNADGDQDETGTGINGVTVNLYLDVDGNGVAEPGGNDGAPVATMLTVDDGGGNAGYYLFDNLVPDDYFVEFVAPTGYAESPQDATGDTADSDADVINGLTIVTTLDPGERDMTWDAGFFQPVSLGNRVWLDSNANGTQDGGEADILGVELALFQADGTTPAVDVDGVAVINQITDASGYYNFTNLPPGQYVVEVLASNWTGSNVFGPTGTHAGALGSPGNGGDNQDNTDDNGITNGTAVLGTGTQSSPITLTINGEPTNEDSQETAANNDSDLTIDFGFYQPLSIGNRVWLDANGNGTQDAGEADIENVEVALFLSDGTTQATHVDGTAVANETTDINGYYNFTNLPPGDYIVEIVASNWNASNVFGTGGTYEGVVGSPGVGADDQDNTDDNGNNDGIANPATGVQSSAITLAAQTEPTTEDPQEPVADNNSDLTIDFGFYQPVSIGNRVWFDANGDGTQDGGEADIETVEVALFLSDGTTQATHADGTAVVNETTDINGYYNFTNLPPGDYIVEIVASNWNASNVFGTGGTYEGAVGSPGVGADDQDNTDDNGNNSGVANPATGVQSGVITLTSSGEPVNEDSQDSTDNNSDLTIDFGFYQPVSIGNRVWFDTDADGVQDGTENGIPTVEVALFLADGTTPATHADGTAVANETTDASGYYNFTNLTPGGYVVQVVANNWATGNVFETGTYAGALGSPNAGADNQNNTDDNGNNDGTAASAGVQSTPITLTSNGEPTNEDSQDGNNNDSDLTIDFGFYLPVSIGNRVWLDTNANGTQDAGEADIPSVEVALFLADGTTPATDMSGATVPNATTDASGYYNFTNLPPGQYVVEVIADNWTTGNVFGTGGTYENALGSPGSGADDQDNTDDNGNNDGTAASAGVQSNIITLASNDEPTDEDAQEIINGTNPNSDLTIDFGFYQLASIGDYVWLDADQDGEQDADEFGIPNVTVTLYDGSGTQVGVPTTTDAYGFYSFTDLTPDDYYIVVTPPAGYIVTPQDNIADDTLDSDIDGTGQTTTTTLNSNEDDPTWDAGLYIPPASIGDYVWLDQDTDGEQDAVEYGILGVTVNLYDSNGNLIDSMLTDGFGYYTFDNLVPGDYYIEVIPLPGYNISTQDVDNGGGNDDTIDSDIDANTLSPTYGQTIVTTLDPGENDPTWDAGLYNDSAAIGDLVWEDTNADGIQDVGELGIPNVTVVLFDVNNTPIYTTTTDTNGNYIFEFLPPGDYYVQIIPPAGYDISPQDVVTAPDANSDSDIDPTTGETVMTTLDPDETDLTWDAGLYQVASLGDYVWEDENADGDQDETGTGINGVTVNLYLNGNGTPISTTVTADDGGGNAGYYLFDNLIPGDYYVEFIAPAGYEASPQDNTGDTADSDADQTSGLTIVTDLSSGENDMTWDAGFYQPVSIGNWVWLDSNADGVQDGGEIGIETVEVALFLADGVTPATDVNGAPVANETTDASGYYNFTNLPPGQYVVEVLAANWTAGNVFGTGGTYEDALGSPGFGADDQDNTDDNGNNDGTAASAGVQSGVITLISSGEPINEDTQETVANNDSDLTIDFGFYQNASLGDYVWEDLNVNGLQDDGAATGINGVTVNLYVDVDGDGIVEPNGDDGAPVATTVTVDDGGGNAGYYLFDNLTPNDYFVEFVMPTNYIPTLQDQGGDDTVDSDADQATGLTIVTTLVSGENDMTWDAGLFLPSSIGDYVWNDLNQDGLQDGGEVGVGGVTVHLYDVTNTIIMTTTTAPDGSYLFDNLVPAEYHVGFVPPVGYAVSPIDANTNVDDTVDSDADQTTGETIPTTLVWDEHDPTWDAGIYQVTPGITIDKSISIARIAPNQMSTITYTLVITNSGNIALYNVNITDTLPISITYNNVSLPIIPSVNGQELVWSDITSGAPFNPGDTFQIAFEATVPTDIGTYINVAEVTGTTPPGFNYPGQTVGDDDDATLLIEDPSVALDKGIVAPGIVDGVITYTIQITNTGPSVIDVLPVVDNFTGPMEYVGGSPAADFVDNVGQTLAWNDLTTTFGDLAPGQVVSIETVFRLTTIESDVTLTNEAQVLGGVDEFTNPTNEPSDLVELINVPTAVTLTSFTATGNENGTVDVVWTTESEIDNFGFELFRSATDDFATATSIYFESSVVGSGPGKTYGYTDTVPNDGVWYYWLVDIDTNGVQTVHGSVAANTAGLNATFTNFIFLPMVIR